MSSHFLHRSIKPKKPSTIRRSLILESLEDRCLLAVFGIPSLFPSGGSQAWGIAVADFNRDLKADIAVCTPPGSTAGAGSVAILFGNGMGDFSDPVVYDSGNLDATTLAAGDFNADGNTDLAVAHYTNPGTFGILLGNGTGKFVSGGIFSSGGASPWSVAVADLNGDGRLDLATANVNSNNVGVLFGDDSFGFSSPTVYDPGGTRPDFVVAEDLNGDGEKDLVVTNDFGSSLTVLWNDGSGAFPTATTITDGLNRPGSLMVADFDRDGIVDLGVANAAAGSVAIFLGDGLGGFSASQAFDAGGSWSSYVLGDDFNDDGNTDLVTVHYFSSTVGILFGDGAAGFSSPETYSTGGSNPAFAATGDFDGDGYTDLVVPNSDGSLAVFLNTTNLPPTADPDVYAIEEDKTLDVSPTGVLTNDTDAEADGMTSILVANSGPSHGTLDLHPDGSFTYTPDRDWHGSDTFQYRAFDGQDYSEPTAVTINVASLNDSPTFMSGPDQVVDEDAGPQTVANWTINISPGPTNESGQSVSFVVTNDNSVLFSQQPTVSPDGTLTYTPAPNSHGDATVTVVLHDDGGTENGGVDTSEPQEFVIIVNSVIDAVIDVKPGNGDEVDPINLGANGVFSMVIYSGGPDNFNARSVNIDSIRLNNEDIDPRHVAFEDIDRDGDIDLVLHFTMSDVRDNGVLNPEIVDAQILTLTADIEGGDAIGPDLIGIDWVRLVPSPGKTKAGK